VLTLDLELAVALEKRTNSQSPVNRRHRVT
jgi:hypothetical protein